MRRRGTHLLAATVSTEPGEARHAGMWRPSLSPSRSKMSLTSHTVQVLFPASLSQLTRAFRKKEGGEKQNDVNQDTVDWLRRSKERDIRREEERENRNTASSC